ncbi:alpha/beta hydrolase [Rhodococcus sp. PvR099]|uniref:alpha/beta hydrolase n=1 Tax=Rhodococcus sp. PvR099 TaxID=2806602 RepID=UPI001B794BAA|nr:alpha/beta hydrolase [Rhodococcus sp. PvR099]MBP1158088.1 pimeloyl-ACP methyl ester carboxylesterase [Rhodococcus sp. PvR099]
MRKLTVITAAAAAVGAMLAGCAQPQADPEATGPLSSASAADLDRYYRQPVSWAACADEQLAATGSECATVDVPLDYRDPQGATIELAISRMASTDPDSRRGILLTNPGGPGGRGLGMPANLREGMTPDVSAAYDIIGMDTRGLGASTPLDCGLTDMTWFRSTGAGRSGFDENVQRASKAADLCWEKYPDVLPHINTANIARDLDVIREALGEETASYYGWSYGTVLGATYSQMFPERIDRLVLDSAADPAKYGIEMFRDMGPANEKAIDDFAGWAAQRDDDYGLGAAPAQVRAGIEQLIADAEATPITVGQFTLDDHTLPFVLYFYATSDTDNAAFADALVQLRQFAAGKQVTPMPKLAGLLQAMFRPESGTGPDYASTLAILCGDRAMPTDPEWYWQNIERARADQPIFGSVHNSITPCAFWRGEPIEQVEIGNDTPALQVQSLGDTRTTYEEGLGMHRAMRGSRLVTVPGRTHAVFPDYPNDCARDAVNDYLREGTLPSEDVVCEA